MDDGARTGQAGLRALRGAGGLRGVHPRRGGRGAGVRQSAGHVPAHRVRREPAGPAPIAVDRAEHGTLTGFEVPLPWRLVGPASREPLPLVIAWGHGGITDAELDADERWARELADAAGALVMLCGARRAEGQLVVADGVTAYADIARHALSWGGHPFRLAVAGRGAGFRLATQVGEDATAWPEVRSPRAIVLGSPVAAGAARIRALFELPPPRRPAHPLRAGMQVRSRDGARIGTVGEVRPHDFVVRREPGLEDLLVPLRSVAATRSAVVLDIVADELSSRAWGGEQGPRPSRDISQN